MKTFSLFGLIVATLSISAASCSAALDMTFTGPNYTPPDYSGEILNGGALRLQTGSSGSINATFTRGASSSSQFNQNLVLFIDSQPGGFSSSSTFSGSGNLGQAAAGASSAGRSTAVFGPTGTPFGADFVLAVGVNNGGAIFSIGADGVLNQVESFRITPNDGMSYRNYNFTFSGNSIGVSDPTTSGFRFYSSYVTDTGSRRFDSMETINGFAGLGYTITFENYHLFGVEPVPEPTNIALAVFGGLVITGTAAARIRKHLAACRHVS